MLLHKWYCSLTIKQYVLVLWVFNWLPCFFWLEWISREDWNRNRTAHNSRTIQLRSEAPFVQLQYIDQDEVEAIKAQIYPSVSKAFVLASSRVAYTTWQRLSIGPRGPHRYSNFLLWLTALGKWIDLQRNTTSETNTFYSCRVMRVQTFDGTFFGLMRARQVYVSSKLFYRFPSRCRW